MALEYININNTPIDALVPTNNITLNEIKNYYNIGDVTKNTIPVINGLNSLGYKSSYFKNELYNQLHILPSFYDVGFIAEYTEKTIELWNTFSTVKQITSIDIDENQNISILENPTLPVNIDSNNSVVYTLAIENYGSDLSTDIVFTIGGQQVNLQLSGFRAILFDFDHNWIEEFTERYEFNTDINRSKNWSEQRLQLRPTAIYQCDYYYSLKKTNKQKLDAILYNNVNSMYSLPLYIYLKRPQSFGVNTITLKDIRNSVFQIGMNVLIKDGINKEQAVISSINGNTLTLIDNIRNSYNVNKSIILPLIFTRTTNVRTQSLATEYVNYEITFEKDDNDGINMLEVNNPEVVIDKIDDVNFFKMLPNTTLEHSKNYLYNTVIEDNGYSVKRYFNYGNKAEISQGYEILMGRPTDFSYVKKLFDNQKGAYQDLYYNNYSADIKIVENINAGDTIIVMENINAASFYRNKDIDHICINYNNNKKICKFIDIYKLDDNREAVVLETSINESINFRSINYVNFIFKGRLVDDTLEINYTTDGLATFNINFIKNTDI